MAGVKPGAASPDRQEALPVMAVPLPISIVRLDARERVIGLDQDGMGLGRADLLQEQSPFTWALTACHRAFWEMTQWPALCASGHLDEALLEFDDGNAEPMVAVSYWRRDVQANPPCLTGMLVPGSERQQLLRQLRRSQESVQAMPAAVLQIGILDTGEVMLA